MGDATGRIFLSYRRGDTRHMAGRLADRLNAQFGPATVFMDVDAIELGADFPKTIAAEVSSCDLLIAIIGQNWLALNKNTGQSRLHDADDFVTLEIKAALDRGIRVIPVLVDEARMPTTDELPASLHPLAARNAARLDHETFASDIERLLSAVGRFLHAAATERAVRHRQYSGRGHLPAAWSTPEPERPYRPQIPDWQRSPRDWGMQREQHSGGHEASPPSSPAAHQPGGSMTSPPRVPPFRAALRVALWWVVYLLSMLLSSGLFLTIAGRAQGNLAGGILAIAFLLGVVGGIAVLLGKEIDHQRRVLRQLGPNEDALVSESAVSHKHVRKVALICIVVALGFGLLIAFAPPPASPSAAASATRLPLVAGGL